jgi:hypothetical protein
MLEDPGLKGTTVSRLREMVSEYENYTLAITTQYNSNTTRDIRTRASFKESIKLRLQDIAGEDIQAVSAFKTLFNRLIGD